MYVPIELVLNAHRCGQTGRVFAHLGCQGQGSIYPIRVQNVVANRQIVQQGEVLKHKADVGNAKASPLGCRPTGPASCREPLRAHWQPAQCRPVN